MKSCSVCGAAVADDDKYCPHCGSSLAVPEASPPATARRPLQWVPVITLLGLVFLTAVGLIARQGMAWLRSRQPVAVASPSPRPDATPTLSAEDYANPWPHSEAPPTAKPGPDSSQPEGAQHPVPGLEAQLDEYYRLIDAKLLTRAYALRTDRSRRKTSLSEFEKTWGNNRSITMEQFQVLSQSPQRATVEIQLRADDIDTRSGKSAVTLYRGKVTLVLEDGLWRYDGGDFQAEK